MPTSLGVEHSREELRVAIRVMQSSFNEFSAPVTVKRMSKETKKTLHMGKFIHLRDGCWSLCGKMTGVTSWNSITANRISRVSPY